MLTNEELSNLNRYENQERYLVEKLLLSSPNIDKVNFTDPKARKFYDGDYVKTNGTKVYYEVKVRTFLIDTYPDLIMERKKLENLLSLVGQNKNVAYINIFPTTHPDYYSAILFSLNARYKGWLKSGIPYEKKWMAQQTFKSRDKKCTKEVLMMTYESSMDYCIDRFCVKEEKEEVAKTLF